MDSFAGGLDMTPAGFPHSGIHGSTPACGSPWLIAANHALLRLLTPRHPPSALSSLTTNRSGSVLPDPLRGQDQGSLVESVPPRFSSAVASANLARRPG